MVGLYLLLLQLLLPLYTGMACGGTVNLGLLFNLTLGISTSSTSDSKPEEPSKDDMYRSHQLWRLRGDSMHVHVANLLSSHPGIDLLRMDSGAKTATLHLSNDALGHTHRFAAESNLEKLIAVFDMESHLKEHRNKEAAARLRSEEICVKDSCPRPLTNSYMTFQQMQFYLKQLHVSHFPRVKVKSIGKSVEGRHIWMVKIEPKELKRKSLKTESVWIEGGIHAREWISPATTLHLIQKLVEDESLPADVSYYIVPMANPDGYEYSRTTERMWRKNRAHNKNSNCRGVDLNRNWDFHFSVGASRNPCSQTYMGPSAFSEPETIALKNAMNQTNTESDLKLVLSLHSYGNQLLYPWGYTNKPIYDKKDLQKAGDAFAKAALASGGTKFKVGNAAGDLYFASGATDDWSKGILKVPFVYTLELRGAKGFNGFLLPASEISASARETYAGLKAIINYFKS